MHASSLHECFSSADLQTQCGGGRQFVREPDSVFFDWNSAKSRCQTFNASLVTRVNNNTYSFDCVSNFLQRLFNIYPYRSGQPIFFAFWSGLCQDSGKCGVYREYADSTTKPPDSYDAVNKNTQVARFPLCEYGKTGHEMTCIYFTMLNI